MIHPALKHIENRPIPTDAGGIRLFACMQNEELRLPWFFDYYRSLGIAHFFIIDNNSTDGTQAFLLAQPDCSVFFTAAPYAYSRFGTVWQNSLMDTFGVGHWVILADADELLVYPGVEHTSLPLLCSWLDRQGYQGLYALMLDMYSLLPLQKIAYRKGDNFLSACDRFDSAYHFVKRLSVPFLKTAFPAIEPIGGPRLRLCFPEQNTASLWPRLRVKLANRLVRLAHRCGLAKDIKAPSSAPQAFKVPLVKWQKGYGYVTSHRLNPIRLAHMTGALLHFKYFQDFAVRVQDAVRRQNHFDGSAEYKRYAELIERDPDLSLAYNGSAHYRGSDDLLRLNLMKGEAGWKTT